jgi:hypothetical protein
MTIPEPTKTLELALVRRQGRTFPLLPIRPLNSIPYTGVLLGDLKKTTIYKLIKEEKLAVRKCGPLSKVTGESIIALINSLPEAVAESPQPEGRRYSKRRDNAALRPTAYYAARHPTKPVRL